MKVIYNSTYPTAIERTDSTDSLEMIIHHIRLDQAEFIESQMKADQELLKYATSLHKEILSG